MPVFCYWRLADNRGNAAFCPLLDKSGGRIKPRHFLNVVERIDTGRSDDGLCLDLAAAIKKEPSVPRTRNATATIIAIAAFQLGVHPSIGQPLCNPLTVADAFMAKNYPGFDTTGMRPTMADLGNIWTLTYRLPRGYYGTVPTVVIEKRSCSAISGQYRVK
jgi:hypothetical protein